MTTMLLPGTSIIYQGEELGMVDTYIPPEEIVDPAGYRDPQRTPMQWDATTFAGDSTLIIIIITIKIEKNLNNR